jgi:hypothetical protein
MTGICARRTARIDVERTYQTASVDGTVGRIAGLHESLREGPKSAPKPPFHCEHETGRPTQTFRFTRTPTASERPKLEYDLRQPRGRRAGSRRFSEFRVGIHLEDTVEESGGDLLISRGLVDGWKAAQTAARIDAGGSKIRLDSAIPSSESDRKATLLALGLVHSKCRFWSHDGERP